MGKCATHSAKWGIRSAQERGGIDAVTMLGCAGCQVGYVWCREQARLMAFEHYRPLGPASRILSASPSKRGLSDRGGSPIVGGT